MLTVVSSAYYSKDLFMEDIKKIEVARIRSGPNGIITVQVANPSPVLGLFVRNDNLFRLIIDIYDVGCRFEICLRIS